VGTDVFSVSYVGNTVVLTLTSVTGPTGSSVPAPAAQVVASRPVAVVSKTPVVNSGLRHRVSGVSKNSNAILLAGMAPARSTIGHNPISNLRSWEHMPVVSMSPVRPIAVAAMPRVTNASSPRVEMPITAEPRMGQNHLIGVQSPLSGWMGTSTNRRTPVKIMPPMLPRVVR
jgi:hypothetical protein